MAAQLVQIYFEDSQLKELYPFAVPYKNELTVFFENEVIRKVVPECKVEKLAICSWKLKSKLRYYIGRPRPITSELLESDYEVMTFTRNTHHHKMLAAAAQWHPGFLQTFDLIINAIGKSRPGEVKIPIYQNHFSCRTDIYRDYVNTYLLPAMDAITNDENIKRAAMADSNYSHLTNQKGEYLQEKIGINFYPLVPFLLERLFSIYVHNKKINVTYL